MDIYNWKYIKSYGKHRYVMLRGSKKEKKNLFNNIKNKILSYPKNKKEQKTKSTKFIKDYKAPPKKTPKERQESIDKSVNYINEGKTPEERTKRMLEEKKKIRFEKERTKNDRR